DGAITALKKSMKLRNGGDGFDWFFLAMAYKQKNEMAEAEKWYEQGRKNLLDTNTYTEPVLPYAYEAADLLGKPRPEPSVRSQSKPEARASRIPTTDHTNSHG